MTAGEQSERLYGGVALHQDEPPAIDAEAVRKDWQQLWRRVIVGLSTIQLQALREEIERAGR